MEAQPGGGNPLPGTLDDLMSWWQTGFPGDNGDQFKSRFDSLTIELVPSTCWESNLRNLVAPEVWSAVRQKVLARAGYRCEVCGAREARLDCHEIWRYEDGRQILDDIAALCRACHLTKHAGYAQVSGKMELVISQLMEVNGWDKQRAVAYLREKFDEWSQRSELEWKLDRGSLRKKMLDLGLEELVRSKSDEVVPSF